MEREKAGELRVIIFDLGDLLLIYFCLVLWFSAIEGVVEICA